MKPTRFILLFALATILVSCKGNKDSGVPDNAINPDAMKNPASASAGSDKDHVPVIKFEEDTHDFGTITEGEKVQFAFKFTNTGNGDLVIRSANGSCGCTVPEWPHEPVPPGGGGTINVTFNSEGKGGMQHKTVTIISNTVPNNTVINITGEVVKADGTVDKQKEAESHMK